MTATAGSTPAVEQDLAPLAKALGHPARARIMRLLLAHDACYCGQLVDELGLAQATVSRQLLGVLLEEAVEVDTSGCD